MNNNKSYRCMKLFLPVCAVLLLMFGCGGNEGRSGDELKKNFTLGGELEGLNSGQKVELLNNGADLLELSSSGLFTFNEPIAFNGSYEVTVRTQPAGQICTVFPGDGAGMVANVRSIKVTCSTVTHKLGGTVVGLASGQSVMLKNNNANSLIVSSDGAFEFDTSIAYRGSYVVTVGAQPIGQTCSVEDYEGNGITANVNSVKVRCHTYTYTVGGSVTGLAEGQQLTLKNNGADPLIVSSDGTFEFDTPIAYGGSYIVAVGTQPIGQICSVGNYEGNSIIANVNSVEVSCSTNYYTISATVSGLASGEVITVKNNGADPVTVTQQNNMLFTFPTPVAHNGTYAVSVATQLTDEWRWCSVLNASGTATANVTNVLVNCSRLGTVVSTKAGSGNAGYLDGTAANASFYQPMGIVSDANGGFYVADTENHRIRKIDAEGNVTTWAGSGISGSADGNGTASTFFKPRGITRDANGNLYVVDTFNNKIRKIDTERNVTTFAGSGSESFSDGMSTAASFKLPIGITIGANGILYVADQGNHRIRKIDPSGSVTTVAGSGTPTFADGNGSAASFSFPGGVAVDLNGNLYVADQGNNRIRKIDFEGNVTTVAGSGNNSSFDGKGVTAAFKSPIGIAVHANGDIYVAEFGGNRIRNIATNNYVSTVAGTGSSGFADGAGTTARFYSPVGIAISANGDLHIADYLNSRIRKIVPAKPP